MALQELPALCQSHGMGVDFPDVVPTFVGQAQQAVRNAHFVFAHDGHAVFAQQVVVVQQASRDGILDGQQADDIVVLAHGRKHVFKRCAANQFYRFVFEVLVCGHVVIGAFYSLDCDLLHICCLFYGYENKKSRFVSCEAGFLWNKL